MGYTSSSEPVLIASGRARLVGLLALPRNPSGLVLFTQSSGSRRLSPHSSYLADELGHAGLATLLLDLASPDEDGGNKQSVDIALLAARLSRATDWICTEPETKKLALGLFVRGSDAAAALQLAARRPERIAAVVSRSGRPDLAGPDALARVRAPTLLIVGEEDRAVIDHNRHALDQLSCEKDLAVIRCATHPRAEQGWLQEIARLAARWFKGYFGGATSPAARPQP
ncbi:MAG: alpha/beta hydrolase [Burkholderiales bacterium]|nr:alpha/beta hydrolase [Burkholderiales bacterium]